MTEFTNYQEAEEEVCIHVRRYQQDMEAAKQMLANSPNNLAKMKGYCGDPNAPKFDQEPVLFKPRIKDILHGNTYDRVFSKTQAFKLEQLRCSDAVVLPRSFLDVMEPRQREQAEELLERGLLIVSICSANTFFSKRHKQLKESKQKLIQPDVTKAYLPEDVATAERIHRGVPNSQMPRKLFVSVVKLADEDRDLVQLPSWILKTLGMAEGQPLSVQVPKWPGCLHFYAAQQVQLIPTSPNYYIVARRYEDTPDGLPLAIQRALSKFKILTDNTTIELSIAGKIVKTKLQLVAPDRQVWLLNTEPDDLAISVQITDDLERLATQTISSLDKTMKENERLLRQGLNLNAIIAEKGLDLDYMQQMEYEHRQRIEKVKNRSKLPLHLGQQTSLFKPGPQAVFVPQGYNNGNTLRGSYEKMKLLDAKNMMDRVTEEPDSPRRASQFYALNASMRGSSLNPTGQAVHVSNEMRFTPQSVKDSMTIASKAIVRTGEDGTMSNLYPTVKISAKSPHRKLQQSMFRGAGEPIVQDADDHQVSMNHMNHPIIVTSEYSETQRLQSDQIALERQIHAASPHTILLAEEDKIELRSKNTTKQVILNQCHVQQPSGQNVPTVHQLVKNTKTGKSVVLSSLFQPRSNGHDQTQENGGGAVERANSGGGSSSNVQEQTFVVPMNQVNMNLWHQQSIVTASIEESSHAPKEAETFTSQREDRKLGANNLRMVDVKESKDTVNRSLYKLSMQNLDNRAQSNKNLWLLRGATDPTTNQPIIAEQQQLVNIKGVSQPMTPILRPIAQRKLHGHQSSNEINPLVQIGAPLDNQVTSRKNLEEATSNHDLRTVQNEQFLQQLHMDASQTRPDAIKVPISLKENKDMAFSYNQQRSLNSGGSNADIQSELMNEVASPVAVVTSKLGDLTQCAGCHKDMSAQQFPTQGKAADRGGSTTRIEGLNSIKKSNGARSSSSHFKDGRGLICFECARQDRKHLNKMSSKGLSDQNGTEDPHVRTNVTSPCIDEEVSHPQQAISRYFLPASTNASGSNKNAAINRLANDSQQSVFDRLASGRKVLRSLDSSGVAAAEEFKNVLKIIDSANPEQYRLMPRQNYGNPGFLGCSKQHHNERTTLIDDRLLKLDEAFVSTNHDLLGGDRKRARSSYGGRNAAARTKSLVNQLRYNDMMLQKGVTGSPLANTIASLQSPATWTENYQQAVGKVLRSQANLNEVLFKGKPTKMGTLSGEKVTAEMASNPNATLIINYEPADGVGFVEGLKSAKQQRGKASSRQRGSTNQQPQSLLKAPDLQKILSQKQSIEGQSPDSKIVNLSIFDKQKLRLQEEASTTAGGMDSASIEPLHQQLSLKLQSQTTNPTMYQAVSSRRLNMGASRTLNNSRQKSMVNVKTGQLSKLLRHYNRHISQQRSLAEHFTTLPNSLASSNLSKEEGLYKLDSSYVKEVKKAATIRRRRFKRSQRRMTTLNSEADQNSPNVNAAASTRRKSKGQEAGDIDATSLHVVSNQASPREGKEGGSSAVAEEQMSLYKPIKQGILMTHDQVGPSSQNDLALHISSGVVQANQELLVKGSRKAIPDKVDFDTIVRPLDTRILQDSMEADEVEVDQCMTMNDNIQGTIETHHGGFTLAPASLNDSMQVNPNQKDSITGEANLLMAEPMGQSMSNFAPKKAVIEINVNKVDILQKGGQSLANQSVNGEAGIAILPKSSSQCIVKRKQAQHAVSQLAKIAATAAAGRVNHDCFPASKRDSVLSGKTRHGAFSPLRSFVVDVRQSRNSKPRPLHEYKTNAVLEAEKVSLALISASMGGAGRTALNVSLVDRNAESIDIQPAVQPIPNLAVDMITVRKKRQNSQRHPHNLQQKQVRQSLSKSKVCNESEIRDMSDSNRAQDEQLATYQNILLIDDANPNAISSSITPKIRLMKHANKKGSQKRIKWQIVKQKVVQSPTAADSAPMSDNITYHKTNQSSTVTGRRVKALKTLVNSGGTITSPRGPSLSSTTFASPRSNVTYQSAQAQQDTAQNKRLSNQSLNVGGMRILQAGHVNRDVNEHQTLRKN